ncbi:MAG: beta-N-acetylhexosaminidase [Chloroflexi bacterium]|nr:beta-N-acetylhexosaminidase [Chloroflexota bacterium]
MRSLESKIGQMLVVGFDGLTPPDYILEWLAAERIGGVILFARNVASPAQVADLVQACREAAPRPILVAIDQEGGVVARLRASEGFTESPGAMALGAADDEMLAERVSAALAAELAALGINWNLAPVVDITHNIHNASVGARSLGRDIRRVSALAAAEVRGFQNAGVAATAKHFPGVGNTPVDTHEALAVITEAPDYLYQYDLVPFRAAVAAGVAAVMVNHVRFDGLDAQYPATLSPRVIGDLLRRDIGFTGVACTDCMEMKAISNHYGAGESAVLAALAGEDIIFFSHTRAYQAEACDALLVAARSGRLSENRIDEAVGRIQMLLARFPANSQPDISAIRQPERLTLMQQAARAGTVLLKSDPAVFPLKPDTNAGVVEFASYLESGVVERGGITGFVARLSARLPQAVCVSLKSADTDAAALERAQQMAADCDVLVLATRNAHLIPEQLDMARDLAARAQQVILVCLRNPYDAMVLPGAVAVLCTCGDGEPSLLAAVDALLGQFKPAGKLPVPVEQLV